MDPLTPSCLLLVSLRIQGCNKHSKNDQHMYSPKCQESFKSPVLTENQFEMLLSGMHATFYFRVFIWTSGV